MGVRENIAHKPGFSIHAEWSYAVALDGLSPDPAGRKWLACIHRIERNFVSCKLSDNFHKVAAGDPFARKFTTYVCEFERVIGLETNILMAFFG